MFYLCLAVSVAWLVYFVYLDTRIYGRKIKVEEVEDGGEGESAADVELVDPTAAAEESEIEDFSIEEEITDTDPDQESILDSDLGDVTSNKEDLDQTA